jgi:hypothetical protein
MLEKKIWANFHRSIELFTQKNVAKLSRIWVSDPGSKILDPEKAYSGSRIQGSKRHRTRIRILNTVSGGLTRRLTTDIKRRAVMIWELMSR